MYLDSRVASIWYMREPVMDGDSANFLDNSMYCHELLADQCSSKTVSGEQTELSTNRCTLDTSYLKDGTFEAQNRHLGVGNTPALLEGPEDAKRRRPDDQKLGDDQSSYDHLNEMSVTWVRTVSRRDSAANV